MSNKTWLALSKTRETRTITNLLFMAMVIGVTLLLGRTLIPAMNVLAEIIDGTR